jgi:YidC/Oxa1 family membrane protein insertase
VSLTDVLDHLFLQPLVLIYDFALSWILEVVPSPGWAIVVFGLVLNLALLPIYFQMERSGHKGSQSRKAMDAEIARIKAHYKGRERYYYIRTVYRQFGHHPIAVIFASADLYLQILVFMTVYHFMSDQEFLNGAGFYVIGDLSRPDGLLFGVNLLPIVMTLLNVVSAILYSKERSKRRMAFILAGLFLVLLYASPAGLVLYWTCNNAFSLVRNFIANKLVPTLPAGMTRLFKTAMNQE